MIYIVYTGIVLFYVLLILMLICLINILKFLDLFNKKLNNTNNTLTEFHCDVVDVLFKEPKRNSRTNK